jgi:hypothetical protein
MRHFPSSGPVATLAVGVVHATATAALIPGPGRAYPRPPRRLGAARAAVTLAAVAAAADHHLTTAAGAVAQTGARGHRQLRPMSPGSSPTSGRYLPTARALHAPGCGTGQDCGGRYQCRTCLNGTDSVDHGAAFVTPGGRHRPATVAGGGRIGVPPGRLGAWPRRRWAGSVPGVATLRRGRTRPSAATTPPRGHPPSLFPRHQHSLRPPATDWSSPPSLARARAIRQLSAGFGNHRHSGRPGSV